jgi:hypothetical protein
MSKKLIFTLVFFTLFFGFLFYLSGISWIFSGLLTFFLYSHWAYGLYFLWKKLRKKTALVYKKFLEYFFYRASLWLLLVFTILGFFSYYSNILSPAAMPRYTLTNGEKTVIFQWMSHIWSENFYQQVEDALREKKESGYVYYYEWVRPW